MGELSEHLDRYFDEAIRALRKKLAKVESGVSSSSIGGHGTFIKDYAPVLGALIQAAALKDIQLEKSKDSENK